MRYYFLGICGTAMASLAILLKQKGHQVWGTDHNFFPPMSDLLKDNNIKVYHGYNHEHVLEPFDIAVIGNVLSRSNPEVEAILNKRLAFASLPEVIRKEFTQHMRTIVTTGTHGKTTSSALMSWVMECANLSPTFLIGGIARNFNTSGRIGQSDFFIIEGDEYDSAFFDKRAKFLHYLPEYLIINNIEFDHSDIYKDLDQIKDAFQKLLRVVSSEGLILANGDDLNVREVTSKVYSEIQFFGKENKYHWSFGNIKYLQEGIEFTVNREGKKWQKFNFPLFGEHQIYNALAVIAIAANLGLKPESIREGISTFKNVKRRLEYWGTINGAPFYDDFAHHPTAIRETLIAVRQGYPGKRVTAIFEPRTNTTVRNYFQAELANALGLADVILISPIYRAESIAPQDILSLTRLKKNLETQKRTVYLLNNYIDIKEILLRITDPRDIIVLMTNGNLGGEYINLKNAVLKE